MHIPRRVKTVLQERKNWCSTKEASTIATCLLVNWRRFCKLWCPRLIEWQPCMDVIEMLDIMASSEHFVCCWTKFWWPSMATQTQKVIGNCEWCIKHEGTHAKAPLWPIIVTAPLALLHIDFISTETVMELNIPPKVVNILVLYDHFMKHIMAHVSPTKLQELLLSFCGKVTFQYKPMEWAHQMLMHMIRKLGKD